MNNKSIRNSTEKRNNGYTMIEVLIGITLLLYGLLVVAQMQIMTIMTNSEASQKTTAVTMAQDKLETLRALPYNNIGNTPLNDSAGIFSRTWAVENNTPTNNMKRVTVTVSWRGKQVQLQTIIASGNL